MQDRIRKDSSWREKDSLSIDPPLPLFRDAPRGEPFPLDSLGSLLEKTAISLHEASGAPKALIGQSLIAAAALAVQGHADVIMDGRRSPCSIFCLSIGASGERKSFIDSEALKPHRNFEESQMDEYAEQLKRYAIEAEAYDITKCNILKKSKTLEKNKLAEELERIGDKPEPPHPEIMLIEEPTYEGIVKSLAFGRPSIGLFSDEGGRLVGGHAMNKDNQLKTIGGFCGLWDGKPISRTRAGEGSIKLYGKRLSLHLMIQPKVSEILLGNEVIADQGFLSRCLIVAPESNIGNRPYTSVNLDENESIRLYRYTLNEILGRSFTFTTEDSNALKLRLLEMKPSASRLWITFHDHIEKNMKIEGKYSSIRGFACKAAEQTLRLAGVLTLFENIDAKEIKHSTLESSIHLMTFYLSENLRLKNLIVSNPDLLLAQALLSWSKSRKEIYLVQVYQRGPSQVRDKATAKRIISILEEHGYLYRISGGKEIDGKFRNEVWAVCDETP